MCTLPISHFSIILFNALGKETFDNECIQPIKAIQKLIWFTIKKSYMTMKGKLLHLQFVNGFNHFVLLLLSFSILELSVALSRERFKYNLIL